MALDFRKKVVRDLNKVREDVIEDIIAYTERRGDDLTPRDLLILDLVASEAEKVRDKISGFLTIWNSFIVNRS